MCFSSFRSLHIVAGNGESGKASALPESGALIDSLSIA